MAIFMCSGKTGSGKSYNAVKLTWKFWRQGRDVWSNTPLFFTEFDNGFGGENIIDNPEYFTFWEKHVKTKASIFLCKLFKKDFYPICRGRLNYFDTIDEVFHIKDAVVLFDEGQTLFRNYDWESVPRLFLYKLEQNRKHGLDLITTAQRVKAVNINYRELIQNWFHFETILSWRWVHCYRIKYKDCDYITEQMQEQDIPEYRKPKIKFIGFWSKKLYETMYDIGFEPIQHYKVFIGNELVKLHLESGMSVKQAITMINTYKKLQDI